MSAAVSPSCVVVLLFVVLSVAPSGEGRYLPTRADNTRYEIIRGLISQLLDKTESSNVHQSYPYEDVLRSKRAVFQPAAPLPA